MMNPSSGQAGKENAEIDSVNGTNGVSSPSCQRCVLPGEGRQKSESGTKLRCGLHNPAASEVSAAPTQQPARQRFHEVFQLKQVPYADLPAAKISDMMKSSSLDNAPTMSLLSVVNGILDESVEKKNGEIPHRVACLLRKVVQEIERRVTTQAEHLKTQNNLFKAREEKYQSRIRVLEVLAAGVGEEIKTYKRKVEENEAEEKEEEEEDMLRLRKEINEKGREISVLKQELERAKGTHQANEQKDHEISALKRELERVEKAQELERMKANALHDQKAEMISELRQELERAKRENELNDKKDREISALKRELERVEKAQELERIKANAQHDQKGEMISALRQELERAKRENELNDKKDGEISALKEELERAKTLQELCRQKDREISALQQELERANQSHEQHYFEVEKEAKSTKEKLDGRLRELDCLLADSRNRVEELEAVNESNSRKWNTRERGYIGFLHFQFGATQELRFFSDSIKQDMRRARQSYSEEFDRLGVRLKPLAEAAENYHVVLAENRKLFNEIQDLKGNIRVYCRVRPFMPGQKEKRTIVEHIGEYGELVIANPAKPGKEGHRMFKFNKVYGPETNQVEVFSDIQPLVRSVLDGFNVCIFAYGQTGSGKTFTMTGPNGATKETWGVNYRALNDLFEISQNRRSSITYEVGVQVVEIYNEQVRDLLSSDGSQKKLGILTHSQPFGLALPDATMIPVKQTSDVIELINTGHKNRAVGATALNDRSSRSHSVVTVNVRGTELKSGSALFGNLHLVDLAGSERVDRSEATGERLKEAQHINKSLSALGDVIFALAQKSTHVPYRNSKLTQVLQSSLGGQAKTLMFVQLNPDVTSFSESLSTLKFAERVSGVELGAAKSSKEGKDVRDLMEQVASLKDTIARRDEEIERLQLLKDVKNVKNVNPDENSGA